MVKDAPSTKKMAALLERKREGTLNAAESSRLEELMRTYRAGLVRNLWIREIPSEPERSAMASHSREIAADIRRESARR